MSSKIYIFLLLALALPAAALASGPDKEADPNTKLREALRNTMIQLRTVETERAALQTANADLQKQKEELEATLKKKSKEWESKFGELTKQAAADKETADTTIQSLNTKVDELDKKVVLFKEALDNWRAAHKQITEVANAKEAERAKLAAQVLELERKVAADETKNLELARVANEILNRYEKFGLGDALANREPFIGLSRVKLQNLVQEYQDKIIAQKIKPE